MWFSTLLREKMFVTLATNTFFVICTIGKTIRHLNYHFKFLFICLETLDSSSEMQII